VFTSVTMWPANVYRQLCHVTPSRWVASIPFARSLGGGWHWERGAEPDGWCHDPGGRSTFAGDATKAATLMLSHPNICTCAWPGIPQNETTPRVISRTSATSSAQRPNDRSLGF
jgi:hypothetical protein